MNQIAVTKRGCAAIVAGLLVAVSVLSSPATAAEAKVGPGFAETTTTHTAGCKLSTSGIPRLSHSPSNDCPIQFVEQSDGGPDFIRATNPNGTGIGRYPVLLPEAGVTWLKAIRSTPGQEVRCVVASGQVYLPGGGTFDYQTWCRISVYTSNVGKRLRLTTLSGIKGWFTIGGLLARVSPPIRGIRWRN